MSETKDLFTMRQVCKSCGLSRATILRMEERGLLEPAYIAPNTGVRYYDVYNVTRILHVKMFLDMGMSYSDALVYFTSGGKSPELLKTLETRLEQLQKAYDEMKLRIASEPRFSLALTQLPQYICYTKEYEGTGPKDKVENMHALLHEVVKKGYRPRIDQSIFCIVHADFMEGSWSGKPHSYTACVPVELDRPDEHTTLFPACQALEVVYRGPYDSLVRDPTNSGLNREYIRRFQEFGCKAAGFTRIISTVGSYTSPSFHQDSFVVRLAVPIEPLSQAQEREIRYQLGR